MVAPLPDKPRITTPQVAQRNPDGSTTEGNFLVWRDDSGNVIKWSTLDEDTKQYAPLAFQQDAQGNLTGSGPDGLSTPQQALDVLQVAYETDSPVWDEIRKQYIAAGAPDDNETIYKLAVAGVNFTQIPGSGAIDMLDIMNTRSGMEIAKKSGSGGSNYGPYRYESTDVAMSSESQAKAILDRTYMDSLGRVSTAEEAQAFQEALNMMEQANPSRSIIEGVSGKRSDSRTQITESGFDPTAFAREYAMSMPEYADTFAATTFMGALDKFLAQPDALADRMEALQG